MSNHWVVVKPKHGHHIRHWETHSKNNIPLIEKSMDIYDAVKLLDELKKDDPEWRIYHVHGQYEPDEYAVLDIRKSFNSQL
jgi:hypothetical protein